MTYSLGRIVEHDPQSRQAQYLAATAPLKTVAHQHFGEVLDQGAVSSCTGNAIAQALNTEPLINGRRLLTEADAEQLYSRATHLDWIRGNNHPPNDLGSSGLGAVKAAREAGYISRYHHAFGIQHTLAALVLQPVIIGISWSQQMFQPDHNGFLHPDMDDVGGHEIALTEINVEGKYVTILNSWGPAWGDNGTAKLSWDDLANRLQNQGDCTVPLL